MGKRFTLTVFPPKVGVYLLVAAGLRLGVIPRHLPLMTELTLRRDLGTILRLAGPASAMALLSRLSGVIVAPEWIPLFRLITSLGSFYAGAMWLTAENELDGRPYWIIAFAGLAVGNVLGNFPAATLGWGLALILCGGILFLFSYRSVWLMLLVVFGAVTLSTLPFTPTASAWNGLNGSWDIFTIFYWLAFVLLFVGFIKHGGRKEESIQGHERWIHVIYPLGLIFMLVTHWFCGIWGWPGSFTVGSMWFSLTPIVGFSCVFCLSTIPKDSDCSGRKP